MIKPLSEYSTGTKQKHSAFETGCNDTIIVSLKIDFSL